MTGMDARKFLIGCSFCFVLALIDDDDVCVKNRLYLQKKKREIGKEYSKKMKKYFCNVCNCHI